MQNWKEKVKRGETKIGGREGKLAWIETNSDYSQLIKYRPIAEAFRQKAGRRKERGRKGKREGEGGDSPSVERFLVKDELINSWDVVKGSASKKR